MKRAGNLLEKIADMENLYWAFWKAKRGKQGKKEVCEFQENLDENLQKMRNSILNCDVDVGNFRFFKIFDPKERTISVAPFSERVLHHALIFVCHSYFENQQIYHSYATRKGKGTYAALNQAKINQRKYKFFLKLDVKKYFDSVNHKILYDLLVKKFKDKKNLSIFKKIISSYHTFANHGLPIGNLTSQYFANFYLSFADRYLLQKLKIPAYVRYMDDMVLWSNDKNELLEKGKLFEQYLYDKLELKLKIFELNTNKYGLNFLGFRLLENKTLLQQSTKRRFKQKANNYLEKLDNGVWGEKRFQVHILPLISHVFYADSFGFRKSIFKI